MHGDSFGNIEDKPLYCARVSSECARLNIERSEAGLEGHNIDTKPDRSASANPQLASLSLLIVMAILTWHLYYLYLRTSRASQAEGFNVKEGDNYAVTGINLLVDAGRPPNASDIGTRHSELSGDRTPRINGDSESLRNSVNNEKFWLRAGYRLQSSSVDELRGILESENIDIRRVKRSETLRKKVADLIEKRVAENNV